METTLRHPKTLKPNPWNTNRVSPENMAKLVTSIRDLGFVTAVVTREIEDGSLQILGGKHRVDAAIEIGLKEIPVINLGIVPDKTAKKIGLVDNSRYGSDDAIGLAQLFDEIGLQPHELADFLPFTEQEFVSISRAVDIDLEALDMLADDSAEEIDFGSPKPAKPVKTHDVLKFRVCLGDAERIRQKIEKTLKAEGLSDDDEMTAAGSALAFLLLNSSAE